MTTDDPANEVINPEDIPGSVAAVVPDDPPFVADNGSPFNTEPSDANAHGSVSFLGDLDQFVLGVGQVADAARSAGILTTTARPNPPSPTPTTSGGASSAIPGVLVGGTGLAVVAIAAVALLILRRK